MKYITSDISKLSGTAREILRVQSAARVFAFHGELGAGKTTFIKALCEQLGVKDAMSSPTFSIVNEYHDAKGNPIYHMDLYRIKSIEEAMNAGVEEYIYSGNYVFIEWPEVIEEMLPGEAVHVRITVEGEGRLISISQ